MSTPTIAKPKTRRKVEPSFETPGIAYLRWNGAKASHQYDGESSATWRITARLVASE